MLITEIQPKTILQLHTRLPQLSPKTATLSQLQPSFKSFPLINRISDGGPPVVLTLVDTSAASLQSLATGRTEFRAKSEGNASHDDEQQPSDGNLVRISKILEETANGSGPVNDTGDGYFDEEDGEVVVVVRAEQKSASSIRDEIRMEKALEESERVRIVFSFSLMCIEMSIKEVLMGLECVGMKLNFS